MKWSLFICIGCLGSCLALSDSLINKEKCDKIGGPGTYEKVKAVDAETKDCIHELFDANIIQNEIDKGRESGTLNKVLGRYGARGPHVNICMKKKMEVIKLCLTKDERTYYNTMIGILQKVADYVYENEGERIVTFVEKGGIECLKSRMEEVRECFGVNPLGLLDSEINSCRDYDKIKNCIVHELQNNCPSSIPANITADLLKFARTSICSDNKIIRSRRSARRVVRDIAMSDRLPHIRQKILNIYCKAVDLTLNITMNEMEACVKKKTMFITPRDEYINHFDLCTKKLRKELNDCLPEKLRYFPTLMFKLIDSLVRLLYDDFGEITLGLGPCVPKLKTGASERDYKNCINKLAASNDDEIPESKAKFCAKFIPLTQCLVKQINDTCDHNANIDKFTKDYKKAMEDPCKP